MQIMTDMMLVSPAIRFASLLEEKKCRVHFYNFEYGFDERGSFHQIELDYLFSGPFRKNRSLMDQYGERKYNESDLNVSLIMMDIWTTIVKTRLSIGLYFSNCSLSSIFRKGSLLLSLSLFPLISKLILHSFHYGYFC